MENVLFHHLSTFYKTMAHSLRFSTASVLPLIFTFSFLLLRLTWNPWIETGVTVRRSVTRVPLSLYIPRVSPLSLHIPHIFPRIENRDYADRSRLSSPIRSLAWSFSVKEFARNERRKKKERIISHLLPFREASRIFPVSFLSAQRFPACDMAGLLILIIDRGIIKVALARGRFQLRISVSLGMIGPVGRERQGEKSGPNGWGEFFSSVSTIHPHPLPIPSGRQTAGTTCDDFSN